MNVAVIDSTTDSPVRTRGMAGFSLMELMITIVIISTLAAIAVPIYNNNVRRAIQTESDMALKNIYNNLRVYEAEFEFWPMSANPEPVVGADWNTIGVGELDGRYFTDASYTYSSADGIRFTLTCAKGAYLEYDRVMNESGTISDSE